MFSRGIPCIALVAFASVTAASDLVEALPLNDRILMLHFDDGYVEHHRRGQKRSEEKVIVDPLAVTAAMDPRSYTVDGRHPTRVERKSKGTDYAWIVDRWVDGRAENDRPDHAKEHWLYLMLDKPLVGGKTATVRTSLAKNGKQWKVLFDEKRTRSEAVHVNLLGYIPEAPAKYAYVYHWMGSGGSLKIRPRRFWLVDPSTRKVVFEGKVRFRKDATNPETFHTSDSPKHGNFLNADVWECDFSTFIRPGRYIVAVEGIGRSFEFKIDRDVYRPAFVTVARGLFHNRSGIALERKHTDFPRPAPHNPNVTPGFKGKLLYTALPMQDWGSEGGDATKLLAAAKGPLDAWGWYQDAGDWDSYVTHLRVSTELLLAFELNPSAFSDGELNIPESGNGLPDILDEAAWLPRFCHRLRQELLQKKYGTGGIGLRIAGDAFGSDTGPKDIGLGSWEDIDRTWVASGEDAFSTYRYAGAAAHLAHALKLAGKPDPEKVDWVREAKEAYAWAESNLRSQDEKELRDHRAYASAALFRLTGDRRYEKSLKEDLESMMQAGPIWEAANYPAAIYVLGGGPAKADPTLAAKARDALLRTADELCDNADKRALRWGGIWSFPMLIGHQTTPWVLEVAVAHRITKSPRYLATLLTTCDYFLGTNANNMTWVTGLGPRFPRQIFHMDAWYNGTGKFHPGLIPYGPWRKERDRGQGPWDVAWPHDKVFPPIDEWPGNERWFDNRCSPMNAEFTVHQNLGPAATLFGVLCSSRFDRAPGSSSGK